MHPPRLLIEPLDGLLLIIPMVVTWNYICFRPFCETTHCAAVIGYREIIGTLVYLAGWLEKPSFLLSLFIEFRDIFCHISENRSWGLWLCAQVPHDILSLSLLSAQLLLLLHDGHKNSHNPKWSGVHVGILRRGEGGEYHNHHRRCSDAMRCTTLICKNVGS